MSIDHYFEIHHMNWEILFKFVMESEKQVHLVLYEDLIKNPIEEIGKIVKFLQDVNGFKSKDTDQRLICLSENLQGAQKRKKPRKSAARFTNNMKQKINNKINFAQKVLKNHRIDVDLSSYKRIIST